MVSGASQVYRRIGRNNPFLRYGVPMISLTVLGLFGLSHLHQGRGSSPLILQAVDDGQNFVVFGPMREWWDFYILEEKEYKCGKHAKNYGLVSVNWKANSRKDVSNVREELEWAAISASKSLAREGPLPGFEERKKKKIDLEQELKAFREKVDIDAYEYKPVPKLREEK